MSTWSYQDYQSDLPTPGPAAGKSFVSRAMAYIIDTVVEIGVIFLVSIVMGVLLGLLFVLAGRQLNIDQTSSVQTTCINFAVGAIVTIAYYTLFEWLYGATPGKLLLGFRVVKETGEPCDSGAAFVRALLRFIDGLFFGLVAYVSMKPPLYQRLGDKAAKTVVVASDDPAIREKRSFLWFVVASLIFLITAAVVSLVQLAMSIR
jgi:uncharacterized RDD family membrane protein YckC